MTLTILEHFYEAVPCQISSKIQQILGILYVQKCIFCCTNKRNKIWYIPTHS